MTDPNQREIVVAILDEVLEQGKYSHLVLKATLDKYQYLSKQQRAFITRLTQGTIERLLQIDAILNQFVKKPKVPKMKPMIRTVLRSSVYQIVFMDGVPDSAVCNEAVRLVKKHGLGGLGGFVNGVLRNISRHKDEIVYQGWSEQYSMPQWIIDAWKAQYDDATVEQILQALLEEKKTCIRVNTNRMSVVQLTDCLQEQGITVEPCKEIPYALYISGYDHLSGIPEFVAGDFYIQDFSSMMVAHSAGIQTNDHIIDVCAAPGGKSLHAAELLAGTGMVEARDVSDYKVSLLQENIARMGLTNIKAEKWMQPSKEDSIEQASLFAMHQRSVLVLLLEKPDIKYHGCAKAKRSCKAAAEYPGCGMRYVKEWYAALFDLYHFSQKMRTMSHGFAKTSEFVCEKQCQILPQMGKKDGFFYAKLVRKDVANEK